MGLSEHKLRTSYENYCKHILSPCQMNRVGTEVLDLVHAIQRFPQFKGLSLYAVTNLAEREGPVNLQRMSRTAQATLMEPVLGLEATNYIGRLEALLSAVDVAKKPIAQFQVTPMPIQCLAQKNLFETMYHGVEQCRKLKLDVATNGLFWLYNNEKAIATRLRAILNRASLLETLSLSFDGSQFATLAMAKYLPSIIPESTQWSRLSTLKLVGLTLSEEHLRHLLSSHASTLISLELAHINLMQPKDQQIYHAYLEDDDIDEVREQDEDEDCGSWTSIILFLHMDLNLTSVRLNGHLSNLRDEAWCIQDPDEKYLWIGSTRPPTRTCVKHEIERYIVLG